MTKKTTPSVERNYDVCLSFAGEDRPYVDKVARALQAAGVRTFYDEFEKVRLWGKDLYSHLHDIYQNQASYCVVFISKFYAEKAWTDHERRSAQARSLTSKSEYILPVRFDDTPIPGIPETVGYLSLKNTSPKELAKIILTKIGPRPRENYLPPIPDRFFKKIGARTRAQKTQSEIVLHWFFKSLVRMTTEERNFVYDVFSNCCPMELPENVHIELDLLRRITGMQVAKIKRVASAISSLGFYHRISDSHGPDADGESEPTFFLEWYCRSTVEHGNYTGFAAEAIKCATDNFCEEHARMMFERVDFGELANSTSTLDEH